MPYFESETRYVLHEVCIYGGFFSLVAAVILLIVEPPKRKLRRGFEVKPTAGQQPATQRKANDHG